MRLLLCSFDFFEFISNNLLAILAKLSHFIIAKSFLFHKRKNRYEHLAPLNNYVTVTEDGKMCSPSCGDAPIEISNEEVETSPGCDDEISDDEACPYDGRKGEADILSKYLRSKSESKRLADGLDTEVDPVVYYVDDESDDRLVVRVELTPKAETPEKGLERSYRGGKCESERTTSPPEKKVRCSTDGD